MTTDKMPIDSAAFNHAFPTLLFFAGMAPFPGRRPFWLQERRVSDDGEVLIAEARFPMQNDMVELPVRGSDTGEILINDHEIIKSLLTELESAQGRSERMQCMERLKAALTIHNATEENLVYPALNVAAGKRSESDHLYHETAEADVLLFELDTMLKEGNDAKFEGTAQKFTKAVRAHIEEEEHKALPHLRERVEPEKQQMLTESVREFRGKLRMGSMGGRSEMGEISTSSTARPGTAR